MRCSRGRRHVTGAHLVSSFGKCKRATLLQLDILAMQDGTRGNMQLSSHNIVCEAQSDVGCLTFYVCTVSTSVMLPGLLHCVELGTTDIR